MAKEFRGDIQGLRAVAVLTVVAAHAGVPFLSGGYVGVDVFYVISGYLIAGLLFREIDRTGTLSLTGFWSRRARRILPAATLVTVVTILVSLSWASLIDTRQVIDDGIWATLFVANIHFARQGVYYFAQDAGLSPLQHYWSLAVEEQFYVVWPLLLLVCIGVARAFRRSRGRRGHQGLPRRTVIVVLLLITVASFAWSVHQTAEQPGSAYFSTLTRAWELGVGALLALLVPRIGKVLTRSTAAVAGVLGLTYIFAACFLYTPETPFPGYAAALPVLGAALLLVAGAGPSATPSTRLLSLRPVRVIGDWSFSLYLWHWPALVLSERMLDRALTPLERVTAVLVVLALAGITHRLVEVPFQHGRPARALRVRRALVLYPASLALVGITCVASLWWTDVQVGELGDNPAIAVAEGIANQEQTEALVRASVVAARGRVPVPSNLSPDLLRLRDSIADVGECDYTDDVRELCPRGDEDGARTVVVIGDSHARAWIPAFDRITTQRDWTAYYLVKPQCTAAHVTVAPIDEARRFTECDEFHDWVIEQVRELRPELVVVSSSPPVNGVYVDSDRIERTDQVAQLLGVGYDELFEELDEAAGRVALLRDVPKSPGDPATCLTTGTPDLGDCLFEPVERSRILGDVAVESAIRSDVEVVDPTPWLCWQGECPVVIGDTLSYRDTDHLTTEYAARLAGPLGLALRMMTGRAALSQ